MPGVLPFSVTDSSAIKDIPSSKAVAVQHASVVVGSYLRMFAQLKVIIKIAIS